MGPAAAGLTTSKYDASDSGYSAVALTCSAREADWLTVGGKCATPVNVFLRWPAHQSVCPCRLKNNVEVYDAGDDCKAKGSFRRRCVPRGVVAALSGCSRWPMPRLEAKLLCKTGTYSAIDGLRLAPTSRIG